MKFGYGLVCYKGKKKGDVLIKNKTEIKKKIKKRECVQGYLVRGGDEALGYPKWPGKTITFNYDEKKLKAALAKQKAEQAKKGKVKTVALVRYYKGKTRDVAESANGKLSKRFKQNRYKKVGTLGRIFARCNDAGAFLKQHGGKGFRFNRKSHTRPIYFRERRGPKGREFFSSVDRRHKNYKKAAPDACLISTKAIKWKKSAWRQVTPAYRYYHPKTKDNQMVVSKGDHKSAIKGGYCVMCWNEKRRAFNKTPICGAKRVWGAIGKDACAMGYVVRKR